MLKKPALFLSVLFHPVFIYFWIYHFFYYTNPFFFFLKNGIAPIISFILAFNLIVVPLVATWWFQGEFNIEDREGRSRPLLIGILVYALTFWIFRKIPFPDWLLWYMAGIGFSQLFALIINEYWKISLHAIGLGGGVACIYFTYLNFSPNMEIYFLFSVILSGIVGASRLYLKAHKPSQVYLGFILGFLVVIATMEVFT